MALTFNGNSANYALKALTFSADKGTVCAWVRIATDRNDYSTFFQLNNVDNSQFVVQTGGDGTTLGCYIWDTPSTGSSLTPGAWYHLALTWDGTSARVYVNGKLDLTNSAAGGGSDWNEIRLGASYWGEPLDGNIAYVKAWDATLSVAEIIAERDSTTAVRSTNLVGLWPTPAGATRVNDTSGNANHLTANGTLTDYANPTLISYVNAASSVSGPGVTSRTVSVPAGTADGDLMLAVCVVELASAAVTAHANWGTPILNTPLSTRTLTQVVYARVASSEPASYDFSWSSAECAAAIITYRNAALPTLYQAQVNNSTTANATAPTLTTPVVDCWSVWIGSIMYGTTFTPPADYAERLDVRSSTAATNLAVSIADKLISPTGATGAITGTAANADYNIGAQVILVPATGSPVTVAPAAASAAATAVAPTVVRGAVSVTPAVAAATAAAVAPTVVLGSPVTVAPALASAAATAIAPTVVSGAITAAPAAASAAATAIAPTVVRGAVSVTPAAAASAATATVPTVVQGSITITPALASATATAITPTVVRGAVSVTPVAAATVATAIAPTVVLGTPVTVAPALAAAAATATAPTVVRGAITIAPSVASAAAIAIAPTVTTGGLTVAPGAASAATSATAPTVVLGALSITPAAAAAAAAAIAPTVVLGSMVTVTPAPAIAAATATAPTLVHGAIAIAPAAAAAAALAIAPAVELGAVTVAPAAASVAATAVEPNVLTVVIVAVVILHARRSLALSARRSLTLNALHDSTLSAERDLTLTALRDLTLTFRRD